MLFRVIMPSMPYKPSSRFTHFTTRGHSMFARSSELYQRVVVRWYAAIWRREGRRYQVDLGRCNWLEKWRYLATSTEAIAAIVLYRTEHLAFCILLMGVSGCSIEPASPEPALLGDTSARESLLNSGFDPGSDEEELDTDPEELLLLSPLSLLLSKILLPNFTSPEPLLLLSRIGERGATSAG